MRFSEKNCGYLKNQIQHCFGYLCAKNRKNIFIVAKVRWRTVYIVVRNENRDAYHSEH